MYLDYTSIKQFSQQINYKLTKEGEEALENFKKDWSELDLAVNTLLQGKEDNYEEDM